MLRREPVDQRQRGLKRRAEDDRAVVAPARAGDLGARQVGELAVDFGLDRAREARVVGDEDRLRGLVMLGLRQEIGGDEARIGAAIGEDDDLGRAGDHVDADDAEHPPLGRRDIGVAGADDLVDRRDRLRAIGERGDRLRAADAIDLIDAGDARRGEHQRIDMAVRRRHDHRQPAAARDLRRHGVHHDRGRIARRPAGNIEPDRVDRPPAPAELDPERVGETKVGGLLAAVKVQSPGSYASFSASSAVFSQAAIAASTSAAPILSPSLAMSTRSKRSEIRPAPRRRARARRR